MTKKGAYDFIVARPVRVVFSRGCLAEKGAHELVEQVGASRVVVIASGRLDKDLSFQHFLSNLGDHMVGRLTDVAQHVPQELVESAAQKIQSWQPDWLVVVGGGSAIGLAKSLVGRSPPGSGSSTKIAVCPTTYSGSEMTDIFGMTTVRRETHKVLPSCIFPAIFSCHQMDSHTLG